MMKLGIGVLCVWWLFQSRDLAANLTVANTNDSGPVSLRQAILDANNNPGEDLIQFCIPGSGPHSIRPGSALPEITEAVTIDGYTQPGAAPNTLPAGDNAVLRIRLDGSAAGGGVGGLTINSDRTVIRGLMIGGFGYSPSGVAGDGIRIIGGSSNRVEGCFIGIDTDGATLMPNWASGVHL